jgi:hypothetical protein
MSAVIYRTIDYHTIIAYDLYALVLKRNWRVRINNNRKLDDGILMWLINGLFEDDLVLLRYNNAN